MFPGHLYCWPGKKGRRNMTESRERERERVLSDVVLSPPEDNVSVILWNDDVTPIEFVIVFLHLICGKSQKDAINIAVEANDSGSAIIERGPYKEMAELFARAKKAIKQAGYTLKVTLEE